MRKMTFWLVAIVVWLTGSVLLGLLSTAMFEDDGASNLGGLVFGIVWGMVLYLSGRAVWREWVVANESETR